MLRCRENEEDSEVTLGLMYESSRASFSSSLRNRIDGLGPRFGNLAVAHPCVRSRHPGTRVCV